MNAPDLQYNASELERLHSDTDHIRQLAETLLNTTSDIDLHRDTQLSDPEQNRILHELIDALHELHPADMATLLESLPLPQRLLVWNLAEPEEDGEVLLEVSDPVRETLIENMASQELLAAIDELDADELASLAPDLPNQVVYEALSTRDEEERAQVAAAMSFEEDQVGALMDFEFISIRADVSCEVVLRYLRRFDRLPDHTDKIFVVNDHDVLLGVLPIRTLLVSDPDRQVADVMVDNVVTFRPEDNAAETAAAFERYDLVTAPVADAEGKLIGRVTIDEMVDVIREESETDMLNMAGLKEEEDLFAPVADSVRNRWVWLAVNLCTAFLASRVIGMFEGSIEKIVALATLMPIVAGIGGNSGNQTITMIVRAMTSGQISNSQAWRLLRKEEGVAIANGLIWGSVMGVVAYLLYHSIGIGLVMVGAMTLNLLLAATVGVMIPVVMQKLGRDPALGSSVLITAVTDSGGFFIFLGLATLFLL